MSRGETIKS